MVIEKDILDFVKKNISSFERGGCSSNEIRFFTYEGKKYVLKTPVMKGENLSPFWRMMRNIFGFSPETQSCHLREIFCQVEANPHIDVAKLVAVEPEAMIFEFVEGKTWDCDAFPCGRDNAYILGQFVGYNHQKSYSNSGLMGELSETDFIVLVNRHMEECIREHWNGDTSVDRKMRRFYQRIQAGCDRPSKFALMMVDMSADQFLFGGEDVRACVDLDAYVIGPVEWELSFLALQVEDWARFVEGYETYQPMPDLSSLRDFFYFLMALNDYENKCQIDEYWSKLLDFV